MLWRIAEEVTTAASPLQPERERKATIGFETYVFCIQQNSVRVQKDHPCSKYS